MSLWGSWSRIETSYGYNDNLLLSSTGEERSTFARGSAEIGMLRLPDGALDFSLFTSVGGTHYFAGRSTHYDARSYFRSEIGWQPAKALRFSVPLVGNYTDEVIDQSDTDVVRIVSASKVVSANIGPVVRWTLHPAWWIEAQAGVERNHFNGGVSDFDIGEGALRLGWKTGDRMKVRLAAERRWRDFKARAQYSAAGRELLGTELKAAVRKASAIAEVQWDRNGHWRTTTRASWQDYRDNGSGYFNYRERSAGHELEWNNKRWLVRVGGTARRVEFAVQKIGFGIDPPARIRDEFTAELMAEREVTKRWTLFCKFSWERSRSNDPVSSYVMNEGLLGLRWNWEK